MFNDKNSSILEFYFIIFFFSNIMSSTNTVDCATRTMTIKILVKEKISNTIYLDKKNDKN